MPGAHIAEKRSIPVSDGELRQHLAAILAADAAGYSRLMALDERATLAALDAAREVFRSTIEAHHGRVIDMAGDSILAVFETASGAVSAALAIQQTLLARTESTPEERRMRFRIGVHLGDVFEKADATVYGDGVNIAARLQALAVVGGVSVSESVRSAVKGKVHAVFEDCGEQQVKNIPDPVRMYRVASATAGFVPPRAPGRRRWAWAVAALAATLLATLGASLYFAGHRYRTPSTPPVVVVLPLANQSGDPARDYFSDGLTEDLINALSLYSGLRVISHQTAATYKTLAVGAQELNRSLGVRYVVKGSVRQADGKLRVGLELSDAANGIVLWSDRYEGDGKEVFAFQDRAVKNLVGALAVKVTRREEERASAKPSGDWQAYDMVLRARALVVNSNRADNRQARALLSRALELAPEYAESYIVLAAAETQRFDSGWTEDPSQSAERAEQYAQRALALGDVGAQARALGQLGVIYSVQHKYQEALAAGGRAVDLNPSDARALEARGSALMWLGRAEAALASFDSAERFDPGGRSAGGVFARALAYYTLRRYADALAVTDAGLARFSKTAFLHALRAATLAQMGDTASAHAAAAETLRLEPFFRGKDFGDRFADPMMLDHLQEGLRKAGL
jgi:TolB-like protein/class 3 adenylate cyclase